MTRTPRALPRAIGLIIIAPLLLSGCLWYFYPADPTPELLFHESFDGLDRESTWWSAVAPGYDENAELVNGRLEVYGPRHLLQTQNRFPTDLTVLLEWSVTNGDVTSQLYPEHHADDPDFSITIDDLDITAELYLYSFGPDATRIDTLRIVDIFGFAVAEPAIVDTAGITHGHLEMRVTPSGDELRVVVSVPEIDLETSTYVVAPRESETRITFGVSGLANDPRSFEEIYLYRQPANLGGLL